MRRDHRSFIKGAGIILIFWFILGTMATEIAASLIPDSWQSHTIPRYLLLNTGFLCFLAGIYLTVRYVLETDMRTFISDSSRIRPWRMIRTLWLWMGLFTVSTLIEHLLYPGDISFSGDWKTWLLFLPLALVITPIQTGAEELFFRAYLGRWCSLSIRGHGLISLISGGIFLALHMLNPEIAEYGTDPFIYIYYFLFGFLMMTISLKDRSFELPIAIHTANNLFTVLLVNYRGTAIPSPALFQATHPDPLLSTVMLLVGSAATYLAIGREAIQK